ncbi:MAG TPA: hypothetical protein PLO89_10135, partial [Spirochaetota bacterium]|nr:hypothetical protein [Spirochaetota bacterium]
SYSYEIKEDLSDLENIAGIFANDFYWALYRDNCSEIKFIAQNFEEKDLKIWIKPKEIKNDDGRIIECNDNYLTEITNVFYPKSPAKINFWQILPGDYDVYAFLANDRVLRKIDLKIGQREKREILIDKKDFKKENGSLLIAGINPTSSFNISIVERPIYLKKPWEENITRLELNFNFDNGEFFNVSNKYKDLITYKDNIITINDLIISDYDVNISSFAYKESNINGVKKISMAESGVESFQVLLRTDNKKSEEIEIAKKSSSNGEKIAKIAFIFNPISNIDTKISYKINDISGDIENGIERLIIEDKYGEEGWNSVKEEYIAYKFTLKTDSYTKITKGKNEKLLIINKKDIENDPDKIVYINFDEIEEESAVKKDEEVENVIQETNVDNKEGGTKNDKLDIGETIKEEVKEDIKTETFKEEKKENIKVKSLNKFPFNFTSKTLTNKDMFKISLNGLVCFTASGIVNTALGPIFLANGI